MLIVYVRGAVKEPRLLQNISGTRRLFYCQGFLNTSSGGGSDSAVTVPKGVTELVEAWFDVLHHIQHALTVQSKFLKFVV